jgi:CATRA-Associated Small Protein
MAVLRHILRWELTEVRWDQLIETIDIAIAAEAADDIDALREATIRLEVSGPVRVTRIGASPQVPPPPPVRDRVNHLIHALGEGQDARTEDEQ